MIDPATPSLSPIPARRLRWRHAAYLVATVAVLAMVCFGALLWYASTPRFAARVHRTLVATLERVTGGKVEIGSFHWSVRELTVQVDDLTIHGKEAPGQVPYFHVDHLTLHGKLISLFTSRWIPEIALNSLIAERPVLHLIFYPDGTTNQPQPRIASKQPLPEVLLNLGIDRTQIQDGLILLNNRAIPWEMASGPLQLSMQYRGNQQEYSATLHTKDLTFRLKNASEARSELHASISFGRNAIQVNSLELKTGNSQLQATGQLRNFAHPSWQTFIHGSIDARQIGTIAGIDELRHGAAQLAIHAHGEPESGGEEKFQIAGHIDLRAGEWEASWLRLRNVDLRTDLIVDNDQCSLTNFSSVLDDGGRIAGSLVMKHCVGPSAPVVAPAVWNSRQSRATHSRLRAWMAKHPGLNPRAFLQRLRREYIAKSRGPAQPIAPVYQPLQADMQAQVSDVTLPLILAATAPKQYWNIGFTTATSGKVTAHWTGDGNGLDVHGDLTMRAPRHLLGLIPVSGTAQADYLGDHRHLVITQADEDTPGTQVHASGLLTLLTNDLQSDLRMDVVGRDLGEFDRLLTILDLKETPAGEPHALPVKLLGNATFHGDVEGSYFALQAVGHLTAQRFEMIVARSSHSSKGGQRLAEYPLTWDGFQGDLSYKPWQLIVRNVELTRNATVIQGALNMLPDRTGPGNYTYDRNTRITMSVHSNDASVADLRSVAGLSYPATGTLTVGAYLTGTLGNPTGAGHVILTDSVIQRQMISRVTMQIVADGQLLQASHIQIAAAGGIATGQLSYNYRSGALAGELTGQRLSLKQVAAIQQPRLAVAGTLGFYIQASGTTTSPIATGALQIENLALNQEPMGQLHAQAHLQNGVVYLTSRAELLKTHLDAGGQIQLSGNDPAQLQMTFAGFNIDPVLRMLSPSGIGGKSSLDGKITLSGPLKQPAALQGDANLNAFTATIDNLPIRSAGPLQISLRDGKLQLKQIHIQGEDMNLLASGTVNLLRNYRLRLHSEGSIDAALASFFDRSIQSSGQVRFVVNARGTVRQPDLHGSAQVSHVNFHVMNITNGLTDMNGEMVFDQDRLVVQRLQGSSGGGQLVLQGFVGYSKGIFVDLTAVTKQVRIRYPKGVSTSANAKLRLLGTSDSLLLSGNVEMMRFGIGSSVDLASLAGGTSGVSGPIDPSSPLNRVRLDIRVTSAPELGFQNSFASLAGMVNLRIRGTLENPSVLGRIDISEGAASFAGTKYKLQQGDITFSNPVTISPQINLEASARVQNYDIIISLHGPPNKLNISYRSEPPLTQADVLALLALGRTNEQATMYGEQQQQGANLTSEALLGGALNAAVSSRVQKLFGVGSVRVDPNFVGTLGESTARVTVEEQVGTRLTLTFATNVNTTAQQLIQGQFDLTRNVSIIAVRDEADVFSMYLQIRGRHK